MKTFADIVRECVAKLTLSILSEREDIVTADIFASRAACLIAKRMHCEVSAIAREHAGHTFIVFLSGDGDSVQVLWVWSNWEREGVTP